MARNSGKSVHLARHAARAAEPEQGKSREPELSGARTVLVVAGDAAAGGRIVAALQRRGFPAVHGSTAPQALYWATREPPALVVLDARIAGWRRLARDLRPEGRTMVVLTDDPRARDSALEEGCLPEGLSDHDPEELARHIGVLLRHRIETEASRVAAGPLVVDLAAKRLVWDGRRLQASPLLLRLAAYLAARAGQVVPTRVLLEQIWGEPWADTSKVHQAMLRLRRIIGEPSDSPHLVGRQRHGYCFVPESYPVARRLAGL
jgi:DNA-binding response OmpR family regulator